MNLETLASRVGGLSNPSKMPTLSWSIPAHTCVLGARLARIPGSVCFSCYAARGTYQFRSTREAMARRFALLGEALATAEGRAAWVDAWCDIMAHRLARTERNLDRGKPVGRDDGRFWRWHDSGDLQGAAHFSAIVEVARRSPGVRFWLPTREAGTVAAYEGEIPGNLVVRLSVPRVDDAPAPGLLALAARVGASFSAVHTDAPPEGFEACDAPDRDGHCGPCRRCWDSSRWISYGLH